MEGLADTQLLAIALIQGIEQGASITQILKNTSPHLQPATVNDLMKIMSDFEKTGQRCSVRIHGVSLQRETLYQLLIFALRD